MAKPGFSLKGNLKEIGRGETALRTLLNPVDKFSFSDLSIFEKNLRYDVNQRLDFIPNNHKFLIPINSPNVSGTDAIIRLRGISNVSPDELSGTRNLSIEIGDFALCSPNSNTKVVPFIGNTITNVTKPAIGIDDIGTIELTRAIRNNEGASDGTDFYSESTKPSGYQGGGLIQAFASARNSNEKIAIIKQNGATYSPASGRFTFGTDIQFTFTEGDIISSIKVKGNDTPFDVAAGSSYFDKRTEPGIPGHYGSSFYPLIVTQYNINEKGQTSFILKRQATNSPVLFNMLPEAHQNIFGHNFINGKVLKVGDLSNGTFSDSSQNDKTFGEGDFPAISQSTTHSFTMGDTGVSTSGSGTEYSFTIKRDVTSYSISATNAFGDNFSATDTITILGTQLGGTTPANDCTITVDSTFTHSGTKTGVLNTTVTGTPNTTNLLTTTGSGTGLQISIKTQNLRVIKVNVLDGGTGHKVGDIITCPKENILGDATITGNIVVSGSTNANYNGTYVYDLANDVWYNNTNSDFSDNKGYFFFNDSESRWQFGALMTYAKDSAESNGSFLNPSMDEATGFWSINTNTNWSDGNAIITGHVEEMSFVDNSSAGFLSGSGTLDLTFKITSATNERSAESPQLMIFNSPNIIQFTRQVPVSESDLRSLAPPLFRAQGGPRTLIEMGQSQTEGDGNVQNIYTHFEPLDEMYNIPGTESSFSNSQSNWSSILAGHKISEVLDTISNSVNFSEDVAKSRIVSNKDNLNSTSNQLIIDGSLQIQDPGKANSVDDIADNIFVNSPRAPAVYIKEEDLNNPGQYTFTRAFSTFDGPWTADTDAGKKHIRTSTQTDQDATDFVSTLNIGKLEFVDRIVIEDYASKNITEPAHDRNTLVPNMPTGGAQFQSARINQPNGALTGAGTNNSPRSTGFTHKMPIVVKEKDESTGEVNDVVYFLLLRGPLS